MKDTFYSISYKGATIHSCYNKISKKEEFLIQYADGETEEAKSFSSAKKKITKHG